MDGTSSRSWVALPPEGGTHDRLKQVILRKRPEEAVGLIASDGRVIELTNTSSQPESNFEITKLELLEVLSSESNTGDVGQMIFWHSHPGGGIGPSRTDMQQKMPYLQHLVVSIVDDDLVYTFY